MALLGILLKSAFLFSSDWRTLVIACIFRRDKKLTHSDWNYIGSTGWVFWNSGDVVIWGEFGSIVIGVQKMNDNVCCGAESLRRINLNCKELKWNKIQNK